MSFILTSSVAKYGRISHLVPKGSPVALCGFAPVFPLWREIADVRRTRRLRRFHRIELCDACDRARTRLIASCRKRRRLTCRVPECPMFALQARAAS